MKHKVKLVLVSLLVGCQAMGSEIWVVTAKPTSSEKLAELVEHYRAEIKEGDFVSSYQMQLNHPASDEEMASILDLENRGRSMILNGNFQGAYEFYKKLELRLEKIPNVAGVEKITLSTKVNLAQIKTMLHMPQAPQAWREAHAWAPGAQLSAEEFSPSANLEFKKASYGSKKVSVTLNLDDKAALFIDGRVVKADPLSLGKRSVSLEPGSHQASALVPGSAWSVLNFKLASGHPLSLKIDAIPFATGSCQKPEVKNAPIKTKLLVQFGEECGLLLKNHQWFTLDGRPFQPQLGSSPLSEDLKPTLGSPQELKAETPEHHSVWKSGWLWAGIGAALVATLVVVSSQSQSSSTTPTHTSQ